MKVLLVEDNPDDEDLSRLALEPRLGVPLEVARDGKAALARLLGAGPLPDVVLMDVNLPGMDGIEVLARLRADPRTAALPVIVLLASAFDPVRDRIPGAGPTTWLTKPVAWAGLQAALGALGRPPGS